MRKSLTFGLLLVMPIALIAQRGGRGRDNNSTPVLLKPARVFDGEAMHEGWVVLVKGERIQQAGPQASIEASIDISGATQIDLAGTTLMPGMVIMRLRGTIRSRMRGWLCARRGQ
jgi:imidazolonepropionase-like amidohydrolase